MVLMSDAPPFWMIPAGAEADCLNPADGRVWWMTLFCLPNNQWDLQVQMLKRGSPISHWLLRCVFTLPGPIDCTTLDITLVRAQFTLEELFPPGAVNAGCVPDEAHITA